MNWKSLDWKFFVTIIATIAGVVIPVYLWQADFTSRAIELKLLSTSNLQPAPDIQNLQLFLNGKSIDSPFLSSFELANTGTRAVVSSDFDTPIEILATDGAKLVSAQITATTPNNIPVKISFDQQRVLIAPFLSNPGDTISFSIITSGGLPHFEPRARIAGIKAIAYKDSSATYIEYLKTPFSLALSLMLLTLNLIFVPSAIMGMELRLTRSFALVIGTVCYLSSSAAVLYAYPRIKVLPYSGAIAIGIMLVFSMLGAAVAMRVIKTLWVRPHRDSFASPPWKK